MDSGTRTGTKSGKGETLTERLHVSAEKLCFIITVNQKIQIFII